jgi:hypothetical protein
MNISVTMKHTGKSLRELALGCGQVSDNIQEKVIQSAKEAETLMKLNIDSSRKRPVFPRNKPTLTGLIDTTIITRTDSTIAVGVGNIEKIEAVHRDPNYSKDTGQGWKMLEWGGMPGGGTNPRGSFSDGAPRPGANGGRFQFAQSNGRMTPKNPVIGIHFISRAYATISLKLGAIFGRLANL